MSKSTRHISHVWARNPDGPTINKKPRGKRTNGLVWGHTLDDFFHFSMTPGMASDEGLWSNSMIKKYGENFRNQELKSEPMPRQRRPWPVLKIPPTVGADPCLGPVDEGSDHEDEPADQENSGDTVGSSPEAPEHLELGNPFEIDGLPKLEEFIPEKYFPDVLLVHDPDGVTSGQDKKSPTMIYKRIFPTAVPDAFDDNEPVHHRTAHLYLTRASELGAGHHSQVYRAALRLPRPLSACSPNNLVTVAAKVSIARDGARKLLVNEAETYNTFPKHLMEELCGYNLVPGLRHPVPVGAVVPKFFGYYRPDYVGCNNDPYDLAQASPIILLEECGKPITPWHLSDDERAECYSLYLRLHYAEFVQQSVFPRNILVQPGPLRLPVHKRSMDRPSFRIIDFGRASNATVCRQGQKYWVDMKLNERENCQLQLYIPTNSMA